MSYTTRRSQPIIKSRLRRPISKSITTVLNPANANPVANDALVVVLPTPPLPDVTTIIFATMLPPSRLITLLQSLIYYFQNKFAPYFVRVDSYPFFHLANNVQPLKPILLPTACKKYAHLCHPSRRQARGRAAAHKYGYCHPQSLLHQHSPAPS